MKKSNLFLTSKSALYVAFFAASLLIGFSSCDQATQTSKESIAAVVETEPTITESEVAEAQNAWGNGIVKIGQVFLEKGDYRAAAAEHINQFYNYQQGTVLFKPTLAVEKQFRTDFDGALSYFVGGNENYSEDKGFAIRPWTNVRWQNIGTKIIGNMAVAMGNYYFSPADGSDPVKVEYSFAYTKNDEGQLKIILHDSHVPFNP
jgi:hypothetical protein